MNEWTHGCFTLLCLNYNLNITLSLSLSLSIYVFTHLYYTIYIYVYALYMYYIFMQITNRMHTRTHANILSYMRIYLNTNALCYVTWICVR